MIKGVILFGKRLVNIYKVDFRRNRDMPIHADYKSTYNSMIKQYGKEKGKQVFHSWINKMGYNESKSRPGKNKKKEFLYTEGIKLKEENGESYIEGFISTPDPDNNHLIGSGDLPDVIEGQEDIVKQLNENSQAMLGSIHHERVGSPITVVEKAELKPHPETGSESAWARVKVNKFHPEFEKTKYEVENKILTGFSIEYDPNAPSTVKEVAGKLCRVYPTVPIFGYGLASRGVNSGAQYTGWSIKEHLENYNKLKKGDETMKSKEEEQAEAKAKEEAEAKAKEESETKAKEEKEAAEKKEKEEKAAGKELNVKVTEKDYSEYLKFKEMQDTQAEQAKIQEQVKLAIKEIAPKNSPLLNKEGAGAEFLKTKEAIAYKESVLSFKEAVTKNAPIDTQWKKAGELVNKEMELARTNRVPNIRARTWAAPSVEEKLQMGSKELFNWDIKHTEGGEITSGQITGKEGIGTPGKRYPQQPYPNRIGVKELAFKDLETDTNVAHANWTYGSMYQSAAELNDIFQPVMTNQLNDERNVWNTLRKKDFSRFSAIQFRARTGRNTEAAGVLESAALTYTGNVGRVKLQQPFAYYKQTVRVSGPEIALSESPGGMGDIYADEVSWSTEDLMVVLEQAIVGTGAGIAENESLGFRGLMITTGNLYGRDVTDAGPPVYTTLAAAERTDAGAVRVKLKNLRAMITAAVENGANQNDLAFYCRRLQQDFIRAAIQDMQRIVPTSARVGFIGKPEFDGVPIFDAVNLQTSDIFLVDTAHTFIGIKVPPTYEETAKTIDARNGFIKIYFNIYSDAPNHNAYRYNFATA